MNPLLELDDDLRRVFSTTEGRKLRESIERVVKEFGYEAMVLTVRWASGFTKFQDRLKED